MEVKLHKLARTTPAIRRELQLSTRSNKELAEQYGITVDTVRKWRNRGDIHDRSHARHNLLSSISAREEEVIKELREKLALPLDDLTEVVNRCLNPTIKRDAIYRCLKRLGLNKREKPDSHKLQRQAFQSVEKPGFIHMDVKHLTKLDKRRSYLYVAIDRATRFVYAEILYDLKTQTAGDFVERFLKAFPYQVSVILSDNGLEWTDRCAGGIKKTGTGKHPVDIVCKAHKIEHRLTKIRTPQTNGMVERFNRRINEAISRKQKVLSNSGRNSFNSHGERNTYIMDFIDSYNKTRLCCLGYKAPLQLLDSFRSNQTQLYTKAGVQLSPLSQLDPRLREGRV